MLEEIGGLEMLCRGLSYERLRDQVASKKYDTAPFLLLQSHAAPSAFLLLSHCISEMGTSEHS